MRHKAEMTAYDRQLMRGITESMRIADPWGDPESFAQRTTLRALKHCVVPFFLLLAVLYFGYM